MRPKKIMCIVFSLWSALLFAQYRHVISTAGGSFENSSGSICFTLGECIIATHASAVEGMMLTQGFQQSRLTIVSSPSIKNQDVEILAYPNPAKDFVVLEMSKFQGFSYRLYDISGRVLEMGEVISSAYEISFTDLAPSIYILKIYRNEEELQAFKIIKR